MLFNLFKYFSFNKTIVVVLILFISISFSYSQVRVPFTQRAAAEDPSRLIYRVKGDYTIIGNTNMVRDLYDDNAQNGNNNMIYVDVDNVDSTFNSSSSTLVLSTENGAEPECSRIVFAGLYWSGRAQNSNSGFTFDITRDIPGPDVIVNENINLLHNASVNNTSYTMSISRQGSNGDYRVRYTFSSSAGGPTYEFESLNASPFIRYRINGGAWIIPGGEVVTTSGNNRTVTFNPVQITDPNGLIITITGLRRDLRTNQSSGTYQTGSTGGIAFINVSGTLNPLVSYTKTFDKRQLKIKGPNSSDYTLLTALDTDIYYPSNTDGFMYSGFIEVTDYVRANGLGEYYVADIAAREGNGGGTGYYAGWGMVVVYENDFMNWRDITIFDGHSYVAGSVTADFEIPISGFQTTPNGDVEIKLGMIAGEGDRPIQGDFFEIRRQSDNAWQRLSHGGNTTTNYFNSSIFTGGNPRNPNLLNNFGMDVCFFELPNPGNSVITNNQTSTTFRYGTTGDTYVIFMLALGVSAYVPEIEGILIVDSINGQPATIPPQPVLPGEQIVYTLEVRNSGTEPINNSFYVFQLPYSAELVPGSIRTEFFFSPDPSPNNVYFDPNIGPNGAVVWDFGDLPLPGNPSDLLATLSFSLEAIVDCYLLTNPQCVNNVALPGVVSGIGDITGTLINSAPLIQGYVMDGPCIGTPLFLPLVIEIDATDYVDTCASQSPVINGFVFLESEAPISPVNIGGNFLPGTRFYSSYPVTGSTIEYTDSNPFPTIIGTRTYFAVPPGATEDCFYVFTITFKNIVANDDFAGPINGFTGANNVLNIFTNDSLNNAILNPANVVLNIIEPDTSGSLTLLPNGAVNVAANTPAGTYSFQYQICEIAFPSNCDTGLVTITVIPALIQAQNDVFICVNGAVGSINLGSVFSNDLLNSSALNPSLVSLSLVSGDSESRIFMSSDGIISLLPNTNEGIYSLTYRICENLNPTNCDDATVRVSVSPFINFSATPPSDCAVDNAVIEIENLLPNVSYTLNLNSLTSSFNIPETSYLINGLSSGVFNVNVTNQNTGCVSNNLVIEIINPTPPPPPFGIQCD